VEAKPSAIRAHAYFGEIFNYRKKANKEVSYTSYAL